MKTAGKDLRKMVLVPQAGLKVAFGENPKRTYYEQKKTPVTRMGIAALLRQAFIDAQVYEAKKQKCLEEGDILERELGLETLIDVLLKQMPLRAHAHRADDIMTALRIAEEFGIELVIEHGTEAHKLITELREANIPVVIGPSFSNRAKVEMAEISWQTAVCLNEAGVLVAFTTDHSVTPVQYLPLCAALAVKHGMDEMEALKAITINPAKILKLDHRIGSLEANKDTDIVVMSGHPLDWRTRIETVYVNGEKVYDII
jgi:imidazolonepropionase-like amidohydrolase